VRCRPHYFDAGFDKSSPGTRREAVAVWPTRVPSAAALISFDLFVPAKSSRSGDILRPITRLLPAKNSRKHFLWISDAEVPRFTSGRVLPRPAGRRSRRSRGLSKDCFCDYRPVITSGFRDLRGRHHDHHRVHHRHRVRPGRRRHPRGHRVRRHNRHRRRRVHRRHHRVRPAVSLR